MKIDPQTQKELKDIFHERVRNQKQKIIISAPYRLSMTDKDLIMKHVPVRNIPGNIEYEIDSSLLAGVIIRVGSKIIDFSLKGKLQNLKQSMYEAI